MRKNTPAESIATIVIVALILGGIWMLMVVPTVGLLMFVGGWVVGGLLSGNYFA
jgi:hypothetical protein